MILVVIGLGGMLRVLWIGYGPAPDRVPGQIRFLETAIADDAQARMQTLFPEGEFFTHVLTGLAEAGSAVTRPAEADRRALLAQARFRLAAADDPATVSIFGPGLVPAHGAFATGWSLSLAVEVARASGDPADLERVRFGATAISTALASASSPFLPSYPGRYWPCDTVVAVSALAQAALLLPDSDGWIAQVRDWRTGALIMIDPGTGLLPHEVAASGAMITGSRGSSAAIIQTFWPAIQRASGAVEDDQWRRFTRTFVTRELGLVGIREYPHGTDGIGDVDSGPLILGVSASASAVGLAAARATGDDELAASLDREADLLGLPLRLPSGTRYGFGVLPVGDAFLAWARTRASPAGDQPVGTVPDPLWWPAATPGLLAAGLGVLMLRDRRGRIGTASSVR